MFFPPACAICLAFHQQILAKADRKKDFVKTDKTAADENAIGASLYFINKLAKKIRDENRGDARLEDIKPFLSEELQSHINEDGEIVVDALGVEYTRDTLTDEIINTEHEIDRLETEDEDGDTTDEFGNTVEDLEEYRAAYEDALRELDKITARIGEIVKYGKSNLYDLKDRVVEKAISEFNLKPIAFHKFNGVGTMALYKIGNHTFHSDIYDASLVPETIETLGEISSENELEPGMTLEEARKTIQDFLESDTLLTRFSIATRRPDLVGLHNMSAEGLKGADALGGFAMPSIAITKDSMGHNEFGDISLLMRTSAFDPKVSRWNKIYSRDAWTPTFPGIVNKPNIKHIVDVSERLLKTLPENVRKAIGHNETYRLLYEDGIQEKFNSSNTAGDAYSTNAALKAAYLIAKGETIEPVMTPRTFLGRSNSRVLSLGEDGLRVINEAIGNLLVAFHSISGAERTDWIEQHRGEIEAAFIDAAYASRIAKNPDVAEFTKEEVVGNLFKKNPLGFAEVIDLADAVAKLRKAMAKGEADAQTVDEYATKRAIDERVPNHDPAFEAWLDEQYGDPILARGIRNDKGYYTSSGKRRSWDALHDPVTLANVVKVMLSKQRAQGEGFLGANPFGLAAAKLKSLKDVIKNEALLKELPKEEMDAIRDGFIQAFSEISERYSKTWKYRDSNPYTAVRESDDSLLDAWADSKGTIAGLKRELNGYGRTADDELISDFKELMDGIAKFPTKYFEAKPMRGVGFDEVAAAIIPNNASDETREILNRRGVKMFEYEAGNVTSRLAALNMAADEVEDTRFSVASAEIRSNIGTTNGIYTTKIDTQNPKTKDGRNTVIFRRALEDSINKLINSPIIAVDGNPLPEGIVIGDKNIRYTADEKSALRKFVENRVAEISTTVENDDIGDILINGLFAEEFQRHGIANRIDMLALSSAKDIAKHATFFVASPNEEQTRRHNRRMFESFEYGFVFIGVGDDVYLVMSDVVVHGDKVPYYDQKVVAKIKAESLKLGDHLQGSSLINFWESAFDEIYDNRFRIILQACKNYFAEKVDASNQKLSPANISAEAARVEHERMTLEKAKQKAKDAGTRLSIGSLYHGRSPDADVLITREFIERIVADKTRASKNKKPSAGMLNRIYRDLGITPPKDETLTASMKRIQTYVNEPSKSTLESYMNGLGKMSNEELQAYSRGVQDASLRWTQGVSREVLQAAKEAKQELESLSGITPNVIIAEFIKKV